MSTKPDQRVLDAIIDRILSAGDFFANDWGRRAVHASGACRDLVGVYGIDDFLSDLAATQPIPYVVSGVKSGKRVYSRQTSLESLRSAVADGGVASIKLSRYWHKADIPASLRWMRALFGSLCRGAAMTYMCSRRSEDVDLFLAGPNSQLGVHYDLTHVFTFQFVGERKWVVEDTADVERTLGPAREPDFRRDREAIFGGPTHEIVLRPGDVLYVPACCVHGVRGATWSLALSLGLRAFNEVDFLSYLLEVFERTKYPEHTPVETLPEPFGELHAAAKMELIARTRGLIKQLETAAADSVLAPLSLPDTLAPLEPTFTNLSSRRPSRRRAYRSLQ